MKLTYSEFGLEGISTQPLSARHSKVRVGQFATSPPPGCAAELVKSLAHLQSAQDFRLVCDALRRARARDAAIIWGFGAHVIKTGLGPILIDLMQRGFISALATNGAGIIHDFEIAIAGATSEDVDQSIGPGRFGMAEETGRELNLVINNGVRSGLGIGQSVCAHFQRTNPRFATFSVCAAAGRLDVPLTVHVAIGTDIIHMHPAASGAALGEGSLRDFRYLASNVSKLENGVYVNCGSAVILPEVFLKAVALTRNRGVSLSNLTTVDIDFIRMYRPQNNVVSRPVAGTGRGYSLTGPHELLIPLLAACL